MRRILAGAATAILMMTAVSGPAGADDAGAAGDRAITLGGMGAFVGVDAPKDLKVPMGEPLDRVMAWMPQDPGTKKWITLDFGPYTIHPGADLSRVDVEVPGADGYAIGFKPMVVLPDGT
ncbi:MAG TPA: hypothetical protein VNC78_07260, partial [Actinomycetota bacterium]|nr:hypothetical protein [Actinomycetota bacterium]